jgi:hypothetical protein
LLSLLFHFFLIHFHFYNPSCSQDGLLKVQTWLFLYSILKSHHRFTLYLGKKPKSYHDFQTFESSSILPSHHDWCHFNLGVPVSDCLSVLWNNQTLSYWKTLQMMAQMWKTLSYLLLPAETLCTLSNPLKHYFLKDPKVTCIHTCAHTNKTPWNSIPYSVTCITYIYFPP